MIAAYISKQNDLDLQYFEKEFLELHHINSLEAFLQFFESIKHRAIALIYKVETEADLMRLGELPFLDNIFLIVIGPNNNHLALKAGQIGADEYIDIERFNEERVVQILKQGQHKLKKRRDSSHISIFSAIHGGAGATTIAINSAVILANKKLNNRILFIDLAYNKGIANLFFEFPNPPKNIVSILNEEFSDFESILENGLYQFQSNLYFIPGIQFHTDKEELEKPENIQKMLNFINQAKNYFSHIIIDVGVFEDKNMAIDLQEIADSLFPISTLSIPATSILATYLLITERSGWRSKTNIIINRYDSHGTITLKEAQRLINKSTKKEYSTAYLLPNEWNILQECWNNIEIAALAYPKSNFIQSLQTLLDKEFPDKLNRTSPQKSTLKRLFRWA